MNIPFYRYVDYLEDGVKRYQCLHCGSTIDVQTFQFEPFYCFHCGVKYEGKILEKHLEYISLSSYEETEFLLQESCIWDEEDKKNPQWTDTWMRHKDPKIVLEWKKNEENHKKKINPFYDSIFQIIPIKIKKYRQTVKIDVEKFYKKTGKKFNLKEYERNLL